MNSLVRAIAYGFLLIPNLVIFGAGQSIFGYSPFRLPLSFLLYSAISLLTILVHEAGHALAARAMGRHITYFAVFPLRYLVRSRKFEFWTLPSGDLGGAVGVSNEGRKTRLGSILIAAAGPAANFVFAVITFFFAAILHRTSEIIGLIAVASLFVGLGNLLPWRARNGAKSDGARILSLLRV